MRKGQAKIRSVQPDFLFDSVTINKLVNSCMKDGKKTAAKKQVYQALDLLKKEFPKKEPAEILEQALANIKPKVEVRPRRIGGSVYQVPTPVRSHRQNSLSIRWLIQSARSKPNQQYHTFAEKLVAEIKEALKEEGSSVQKRQDVEKMAEANKAFSHLRW